MARLKIQGKTYKVPAMDDLSLDDILVLDAELQERYRSSWVKVQQFVRDTDGMSEDEAENHPMSTLMGGVTVWMVLRVAGKQSITMQEALAIPATAIEGVVQDAPKDHLPKKPKPRKGSAPAAVPEPKRTPAISSLPTISTEQSESA